MHIGEKIKELRRKRDMTQEKLADCLSVSYQSVSKWETGVTSPDLSLIVPLARLFKVTTDELFCVEGENGRRAYFDAAYENYWQKDTDEMLGMAAQAAAEFPGDCKYLEWLASMEYYAAFDDDYRNGGSDAHFRAMLEKSIKHYGTVIESCADSALRERAICGVVLALKYAGRPQEAKKYAELVPEKQGYSRDMLLALCLEGDELLAVRQRLVYAKARELLDALRSIWSFQTYKTVYVRAAAETAEAIVSLLVDDRGYLGFYWDLYQLYIERAELCMADGDCGGAVKMLAAAKEYAAKRDSYNLDGKRRYTCTLLDHVEDDLSCELLPTDSMDCWNWNVSRGVFDPLRGREDFIGLLKQSDAARSE